MADEERPGEEIVTAIVVAEGEMCRACAWLRMRREQALEVQRISRTKSDLMASGAIKPRRCPVCVMALDEINKTVPIELEGMACSCGGKDFRFAVSSLKKNPKKRTEWVFDLDVICKACNKTKFHERLLSFFKLRRLTIGASGVDVQLN